MANETPVNGDVQFVADGRERLVAASRASVEAEVRSRYIEQLAAAGLIERLRLELRIRREIRRELERIAPVGALY
jgi:hypothetical protein